MDKVQRRLLIYLPLIGVITAFGLPARLVPQYLPSWYVTYAGDFLWAMLVFFLYALVFRLSTKACFSVALLTAYLIEISQLFHPAWLDALRSIRLFGFILGFGFLWSDLVAYTLGISLAAGIDRLIQESQNMPAQKNFYHLPSNQYAERPEGIEVDTIILHSMHNPEKKDSFSALSCKECLDKYGVSSHYLIDMNGIVWQLVPEDKKAWHAGISIMPEDGREGVNDFSIGIELINAEHIDFTQPQYSAVARLTKEILSRHPVRYIYGHCDIAPDRKTDPWGFDWSRYQHDVLRACSVAHLRFSPSAARNNSSNTMCQ